MGNQVARHADSEPPPPVPDTPPDPRYGTEASNLGHDIRARAEEAEPEITRMMIAIAQSNGATMEQLEYRLKSTESLTRKIYDTGNSKYDGDMHKAANAVDDAARYTMVVDDDVYVRTLQHIAHTFEGDGFSLLNKNYWLPGDAYDGMNIKLTKGGITAELQLLTPESLEAKEHTHADYETYRDPSQPMSVRKQAWDSMVAYAAKTPRPQAYQTLMSIGTLAFETPSWAATR
jgi:hypothetical protein